jgi:hypothetical protein
VTAIETRWTPLGEGERAHTGDYSPLEVVWYMATEELEEGAGACEEMEQALARAILDIRERALDAANMAMDAHDRINKR